MSKEAHAFSNTSAYTFISDAITAMSLYRYPFVLTNRLILSATYFASFPGERTSCSDTDSQLPLYFEFTEDEIDRLENYCLALGIKGYKKWQQAWARKTKEADEEEVEKLNHLRVKFVEKIDPLMFVSRQKKKTVLDITLAVYEFIAGEHLQEKLEQQQKFFAEQGELTLAKEYEQIYRIVMELFDKFSELLGDEPITLKEYCELLDAGFEEAKVGVIPPSIDQVVIGDVERTRMKDIRALFFVGARARAGQLLGAALCV